MQEKIFFQGVAMSYALKMGQLQTENAGSIFSSRQRTKARFTNPLLPAKGLAQFAPEERHGVYF